MADVIDISLHRASLDVVDRLLEERGLAFFLRREGALPFALDPRRIRMAVEVAARKAGRQPVPEAREACYRAVRRKLIARLAQAMVGVGF